MPFRSDSFTQLRETMRWRVAMALSLLIIVLMVVLGSINVHLGYADTAWLAWGSLALTALGMLALLWLPRGVGGTLFFILIAAMLVGVVAYGWVFGRPMVHWAYMFPPVMVLLLRARTALAGMLVYGAYVSFLSTDLLPGIDVIRFASGYGLLVCFMFTYALLQERAADMLRFHSDHDALSNCLNRRTFNEALERMSARGEPSHFLLIDLDHFKAINDRHGHLLGDRVITESAAALGRELDPGVPLYRYGGEEFAVLLPGDQDALALAERLRRAVEASRFSGLQVTVSVGVASWRPDGESVLGALDRADRALYDAKHAGRNRVLAAD